MRRILILILFCSCASPALALSVGPESYDALLWSPIVVHGVVVKVQSNLARV